MWDGNINVQFSRKLPIVLGKVTDNDLKDILGKKDSVHHSYYTDSAFVGIPDNVTCCAAQLRSPRRLLNYPAGSKLNMGINLQHCIWHSF